MSELKPVYALSVRQPWAFLICIGWKDIENRNWPLADRRFVPKELKFPARIYIHAGKTFDEESFDELVAGDIGELTNDRALALAKQFTEPCPELYGAVIGEVTITGCVTSSPSPWFVGPYGFTLADAVLYPTPIPCRGQLGFFKPNIEVVK